MAEWKRLPFVELCKAPAGVEEKWLRLAAVAQPAPKRWINAYLAGFAIGGRLRFTTLDADFEKYRSEGLDLLRLKRT
jgi:predicted nucleic acid-binding protein